MSLGKIAKTESEYKQTVVRLLAVMRRSGELPFDWITDNTRRVLKPWTYESAAEGLRDLAETYRREVWRDQPEYVEIWLEKDALSGVLYESTERYDVPLMVTRGYPSLTYLHSAAETISEQHKPAYLFYFGDYDPSGLDITRNVQEGIRELAPAAEIHFQRVAVTQDQIVSLDLPTRPTKVTDSRSRNFEGESIEVDAIPPATLRTMVEVCIQQHLDSTALRKTGRTEKLERKKLAALCV